MSRDFTNALIVMLGSVGNSQSPIQAWEELERSLNTRLPLDYKMIVENYAPVQLNGHLFLNHPVTPRWNLGEWMADTIESFTRSDLSGVVCPGFSDGPSFGGPSGLIPLLDTDRGEYAFGVAGPGAGEWRILVCDGDEPDFYEYRMCFSEWLYRYLIGEDMFGPDSAVFYPGPVAFESMPMVPGELSRTWQGPARGM